MKTQRAFPILLMLFLAWGSLHPFPAAGAPLPAPEWLPAQRFLYGPQIIATWKPVAGATRYVIYLDDVRLADSPFNQYIGAVSLKAGEHHLEVSAVDAYGVEGTRSLQGWFEVVAVERPRRPIYRLDLEEKVIRLRWEKVEGQASYDLYKRDGMLGPWRLLATLKDEEYRDAAPDMQEFNSYYVVARDSFGIESEPSEVLCVDCGQGPSYQEDPSKRVGLKIVGMRREATIDRFGEIPARECKRLWRGPDGTLWGDFGSFLAEMEEDLTFRRAYVLDPGFRFPEGAKAPGFAVTRVEPPTGLARPMEISGVNFVRARSLLVSDSANLVVHELDLAKGAFTWRSDPVKMPTPEEFAWRGRWESSLGLDQGPALFKEKPPKLGVAERLPDGSIVVTEMTGDFWIILNQGGKTVDWFAHYGLPASGRAIQRARHNRRLGAASSLMALDDGSVIALLPTVRGMVRIDPRTRFARWMAGNESTFIGGFLSLDGWATVPGRPSQLLVADKTLSHLQVFDLENGRYQYSLGLGGEAKKPDPSFNNNRPLVDFTVPRWPCFSRDGKTLLFQAGDDGVFYRYEILEPLPESRR